MVCQKESGDEGNAPLKPKSGKPVSVKDLKTGELRSSGGASNKNGPALMKKTAGKKGGKKAR
jgi:hypothetical protein